MNNMTSIYWFFYSLSQKVFTAFFSFRVLHRERRITQGPVLIVSNHESYFDPPLVGTAYPNALYFLARKTLFRSVGGWLYPKLNAIPVDQDNPDIASLKTIIKLLNKGESVLIFPEGSRTLDGNLQPAQAGTGFIIAKTQVPVQPVRIFGAREALKRGSKKVTFSPMTVVIGEPIGFSEKERQARGKAAYQALSDKVMEAISSLHK